MAASSSPSIGPQIDPLDPYPLMLEEPLFSSNDNPLTKTPDPIQFQKNLFEENSVFIFKKCLTSPCNPSLFQATWQTLPSLTVKESVTKKLFDEIVKDRNKNLHMTRDILELLIAWLDLLEGCEIHKYFNGVSLELDGVCELIRYLKQKGTMKEDFLCSVCRDSHEMVEEIQRLPFQCYFEKAPFQKKALIVRNFHPWSDIWYEHTTLVYMEKRQDSNPKFLILDSLGDICLHEWGQPLLEKILSFTPPESIYLYECPRQRDDHGCKLFCLKDACYLSKHAIFEEIGEIKEIKGQLSRFRKLPPLLHSYTQSYTEILQVYKTYQETPFQEDAEKMARKAEKHKVPVNSLEGKVTMQNFMIADQVLKFGKMFLSLEMDPSSSSLSPTKIPKCSV